MDERELIRQMKSGDRASFDQIYEKYHVPLFRSAYLICGNREDAEDVLQDLLALHWAAAQRGEFSLLDLPDHDAGSKEKG